jgi:catechol 2,3-dioxygenase-like lactoylglutathione lyase family enzyme
MPRVRYIAILAQDPTRLAAFYRNTLGLCDLGQSPAGDLSLTDGQFNLTVFRLRPELGEARMDAGLHHIGIDVDNFEQAKARFRRFNPRCVMVPEPGDVHHGELRFHDPEYNPVSLSQRRFDVPSGADSPHRLVHIGFDVLDPESACDFYVRVFGFIERPASESSISERADRTVSDGHITLSFHDHFEPCVAHRPRYGINHLRFAGDAESQLLQGADPEGNQIDVDRFTSRVV